jgi:hypothetical protein
VPESTTPELEPLLLLELLELPLLEPLLLLELLLELLPLPVVAPKPKFEQTAAPGAKISPSSHVLFAFGSQ